MNAQEFAADSLLSNYSYMLEDSKSHIYGKGKYGFSQKRIIPTGLLVTTNSRSLAYVAIPKPVSKTFKHCPGAETQNNT